MLHSTAFQRMKRRLNMGKTLATLLALAWFGFPTAGRSQDSPSSSEGTLTLAKTQVLSRPTGAIVYFEGEYGLAGRAPYTIAHHLKG